MKTLPLSLFVFTTVFLLSSAFPQDTGNDGPRSLVETRAREIYLQRRKPPPNIPGPKLLPKELSSAPLVGIREEKTRKRVSDSPEKGRMKHAKLTKNGKNVSMAPLEKAKTNDENLVSGDKHSSGGNEKENQRRGGLSDFLN